MIVNSNEGCALAPNLFGILFSMLLKRASSLRIKLQTRIDGNLFNIACLRAKRKVKNFTVRDLLFADDAALVAHTYSNCTTYLNFN